ncbi:MAG: helix-turn-helix transcriptional regulator [Coprococcus sp.]|nr:helix-turn-helix transcriptional regulator [Coprococcus sp.]
MEKKTIGSFIAALRKANGMTQKELADMLNVSDKSVSRWERDETAPDLTLIPIIADIFHVTSDELLRGERINNEAQSEDKIRIRSEKQIQIIISKEITNFSVKSTVSIGIAAMGLMAAIICNFGFYRAYIGFFLATCLYIIAVICETIFLKLSFSSINNEDFDYTTISKGKYKMINIAKRTFVAILVLFAICMPLVIFPYDAYMGISIDTWFSFGICVGLIALLLCVFVCHYVDIYLRKRDTYILSEQEKAIAKNKDNYFKKWMKRGSLTIIITIILTIIYLSVTSDKMLVTGNTFYNYDDFKAYMEIGTDYDDEYTTYYDENNNEISKEEALTEYIYDVDGTILCQYMNLNQDVVQISYGTKDGALPITVYTDEDLQTDTNIRNSINFIWFIIYAAEIILFLICYLRNIKKIENA